MQQLGELTGNDLRSGVQAIVDELLDDAEMWAGRSTSSWLSRLEPITDVAEPLAVTILAGPS